MYLSSLSWYGKEGAARCMVRGANRDSVRTQMLVYLCIMCLRTYRYTVAYGTWVSIGMPVSTWVPRS